MRTQPNTTAPDLLATARAYWDAGLCPMPRVVSYVEPAYIDPDGEVRSISWGKYKVKQPDWPTIERWFARSDPATGGMTLLTGSSAHPALNVRPFSRFSTSRPGNSLKNSGKKSTLLARPISCTAA